MAITGTFATIEQVRQAIDSLIAAGVTPDVISAITAAGTPVEELTTTPAERLQDLARSAGLGALIGGAAGLVIASFILPGLGLLVAGPLVIGGALAGGLIGAFRQAGYSPEEARLLAERVESGKYALLVHDAPDPLRVETLLKNAGADDVR